MRVVGVMLAAVLALTGCEVDPGAEPGAEVIEAPGGAADLDEAVGEEPVGEAEPVDVGEAPEKVAATDDERVVVEFAEPVVWEHPDGLRLQVDELVFASRQWAEREGVAGFLEDDTQGLVTVRVTAVNRTGDTISWYPDQGTLVVGSEQREAALFISGDVGGSDWHDGVEKSDPVVFEFRTPLEQLRAASAARYIVRAAHSTDDWMRDYGEQVDLTLSW